MQHRAVITAEPAADLRQAGVQHLKAQQHGDLSGQRDPRRAASAEKLTARHIELRGDGVGNERGR
jgi:hypothetical protein